MTPLYLTPVQATELAVLLDETLGDLSYEIADTDNPDCRNDLRRRRQCLRAIRDELACAGVTDRSG
jgi:hypothetical protein